MPAAPRKKSKATDVAFRILGVPDNLKKHYPKPRKTKLQRQQEAQQKMLEEMVNQSMGGYSGIL